MNDKIYEIRVSDYDINVSYLFTHIDNISEEQFNQDVKFILNKYGNEYLKQESQQVDGCKWIYYVIPMLEKDFGYKLVHPEICDLPNDIENPSEHYKGIYDKALIDKMIEHNVELDKKFEEEYLKRNENVIKNETKDSISQKLAYGMWNDKDRIAYLFITDETYTYGEIAERLGLDLKVVVDICNELEAEGKIKLDL